jgi:glycosyltransferase involved in cell wall biosynthesis
MKIVVLGAQPEWLSGLRGPLIRAFLARGHEVVAVGSVDMPDVRSAIESWGARYEVVKLARAGLNPFADVLTLARLVQFLRREKPDLLFAYTVKPIVYGMLASSILKIPRRFGMITGRGYAFIPGSETSRKLSRPIVSALYRIASRVSSGFIFHNHDDEAFFRSNGLVPPSLNTICVGGSGIDLERFTPGPLPQGAPVFLMIGRLIADKGVREFVEAGIEVRRQRPMATFNLVGPLDPSPNAIQPEEVEAWRAAGIGYLGAVGDVRPNILASSVLILPSYAEGLPRSVLEAMACGRPIITTDAPGCRETVDSGVSGFLVPVRDAHAIAKAAIALIDDPDLLRRMGEASLALAQERFDVNKVNASICEFVGA